VSSQCTSDTRTRVVNLGAIGTEPQFCEAKTRSGLADRKRAQSSLAR